MTDISGLLSKAGVKLEAKAYSAFGAAVANQLGGGGTQSSTASTSSSSSGTNSGSVGTWDATPYASAFASGAGGYDTKTKFLFKVTFHFTPDVASALSKVLGLSNASSFISNLTFVVKQIDLPRYKFEYEEVNMYNFRTQILKRITHDELGFQMYDTTGNQGMDFVNAYLQILQPLARQSYTSGYSLEDHGFAFTSTPSDGNDTAVRAVLGTAGQSRDILDEMTIDQFYLSRDKSAHLSGTSIVKAIKVNTFTFTNPRLTHFEFGDQDHEKGAEPTIISCGFTYDALYLKTGEAGADVNATRPTMNDDLLSNVTSSGNNTTVSGGGGSSPFKGSSSSSSSRTNSSTDYTSNANLSNSSGGGQNTSVSGTLGTNAARTLANMGSTSPGIALSTSAILSDNSTSQSETQVLSSQKSA